MKTLTAVAMVLACVCGACSSTKTTANTETTTPSSGQTASLNQSHNGQSALFVTEKKSNKNQNNALAHMDDATREWFKSTLPKTEHAELFGHMLGQWATTMTWRMSPESQPEVSTGTATNTPEMQRFVKQDFTGEMLPGMKFQGFALFGFNNSTEQYESIWCDNTTTAITTTCGTKQADGSILWTGTYADPATGEQRASKATLAFNGLDAMTYTVWDRSQDGKEFPSLKVDYTRVQTNASANATHTLPSAQSMTTPNKPWPKNLRHTAGVTDGQ